LIKLTVPSSGTLYPLLIRFEGHALLESNWEEVAPAELGRPRRRLSRITPYGVQRARLLVSNIGQPLKSKNLAPALAGALMDASHD
jgi:DNA-binding PadR family transcriptional regulator